MKTLISLIIMCLLFSLPAKAEIYIADEQSFMMPALSLKAQPNFIYQEPLSPANFNARFTIDISVQSSFPDIIAMICDEPNAQKAMARKAHSCIFAGEKRSGNFRIEGKNYSSNPHYLILDNSYSLLTSKKIQVQRHVTFNLGSNEKQRIEGLFEQVQEGLHKFFIFERFNFSVIPCGQKNAFSAHKDGSIVICSEILIESAFNNNAGLVIGTLMHELGHSLLNLWGLPNFDNEKTADEFAVVFMLMGGQQNLINNWMTFFENGNDPYLEARAAIDSGDMHPLNYQRIKAIKNILANPLPVLRRWNKVLYPNMTDEFLTEIINNSDNILGADIALAEQELARRAN